MHLEWLERYARLESRIHRLDPRVKWLSVGGFILVVLMTRPAHWPIYVLEAAFVVILQWASGVPWRYYLGRLGALFPLLLMMALGAPLLQGLNGGWDLFAGVLVKSMLSLSMLLILVATTRFDRLLAGLRGLGVPRLFVAILGLTVRYFFVLRTEYERMRHAREARSFRTRRWAPRRADWLVLSNMIGVLFLRSLGRAENVHQAMLARGWTGEVHTLDDR